MKYRQIQNLFGCLIPLGSFLIVSIPVFIAMFSSETGYGWLTIVASFLLGFCALLVTWALGTPIINHSLKNDLKKENSETRLAHWVTPSHHQDVYLALNGLLLNGKICRWDTFFVSLKNITLTTSGQHQILQYHLTRDLGRSPAPFTIDVIVPEANALEAEHIRKRILEHSRLIDKSGKSLVD